VGFDLNGVGVGRKENVTRRRIYEVGIPTCYVGSLTLACVEWVAPIMAFFEWRLPLLAQQRWLQLWIPSVAVIGDSFKIDDFCHISFSLYYDA
jgi:hypothetical protein